MISHVKFVGVCVRDQERALDFYTNKLGFKVYRNEPMGPTVRWIEVATPTGDTRLALFTPPGLENRIGTFAHVALACDDVEATYRELRDRGVTFVREPEKQSWGTSAIFVDPDGNSFVLSSRT